ncbi:MAG TPA: hypothetical protein VNF26_11375 [Candidatus Baltobacterales bacterium]|nr:hypothetical protein [Candidatus Baltobacterales bacterium]
MVIWLALIWVCLLVIIGLDQHAQTLTAAVIWAAPQAAVMMVRPLSEGVLRWIEAARFVIADWVVLLFAADVLALALVSSHRWAKGWQPQVRLGEWMELPRPAPLRPVTVSAVDEINRRFAAWGRVAAAPALTGAAFARTWFAERAIAPVGRELRRAAHAVGAAPQRMRAEFVAALHARRSTAMRSQVQVRLMGGAAPQMARTDVNSQKPPEKLPRSEKNVVPKDNRPERLAS